MTKDDPADFGGLVKRVQATIDSDEVVEIKELPDGTEITLLTSSGSLYEMLVVDAKNSLVRISGGMFRESTDVSFVGATFGDSSSVWLGRIGKAYRLELFMPDTYETVRTSSVQHITVKGVRSVGTGISA